jgi:molybdopterin-synthase adenylyltransferase
LVTRHVNFRTVNRLIAESAEAYGAPDGRTYRVIGIGTTASIAGAQGVSPREVEIAALEQGIVPLRYLRNIGTIGHVGQIKLLQSIVAVVGAGGLGGTAIELLARQGAGHLIIIDDDSFTEQNLNRQILCSQNNLGEHKADAAARRVAAVNSAVRATVFRERLTPENAQRLLRGAHLAVDGLDNLPSRLAVEQACRQLAIPYVYGAIAGFNGQLMTIFPRDAGLSAVYGPCCATMPEQGIETRTGTPPATPAVIAAMQVQEVVKILTGVGEPVRHRILMVDIRESTLEGIELVR